MKTNVKIFWIKYIAVGVTILTLLSCDNAIIKDYNLKTNFVYKNLTTENIEIVLFDENNKSFKTYIIDSNKEINFSLTQDGSKNGLGQPFAFENDSRYIAKKVVIKFIVSNECLSFSDAQGILNVKEYDNFSETMYNTSNNTLIYNIDSVELNNATTCL